MIVYQQHLGLCLGFRLAYGSLLRVKHPGLVAEVGRVPWFLWPGTASAGRMHRLAAAALPAADLIQKIVTPAAHSS